MAELTFQNMVKRNRRRLYCTSVYGKMTYAAMEKDARCWRKRLENDLFPGDVLAVPLAHFAQCPGLPWAVWSLNAVLMPLDPRLSGSMRKRIYEQIPLKKVLDTNDIPCGTGMGDSFDLNLDNENPALVILTSGSTGFPRPIVLSLRNLHSSAVGINRYFELKSGERWLHVLPDYHIGGFAVWMRCFLAGACVVHRDHIREGLPPRIQIMSLVVPQLEDLLNAYRPTRTLRAVLLGGSSVPPKLIDKGIKQGWPLYSSYGLTEMASTVAIQCHRQGDEPAEAGADILPERRLKIKKGRLWLKGPMLAMGYYRERRLIPLGDNSGWYATNDSASITDNRVTIHGRLDRVFISGGENVQPEIIEKTLLAVYGVQKAFIIPLTDSRYGAVVAAFIEGDGTVSGESLRREMSVKLPRYMQPAVYYRWPDLKQDGLKWQVNDFMDFLKSGKAEFLE